MLKLTNVGKTLLLMASRGAGGFSDSGDRKWNWRMRTTWGTGTIFSVTRANEVLLMGVDVDQG